MKYEAIYKLKEIEARDGNLTPDAVLAEAADKLSPLHEHFEWDNKKAATQYRLDQARALIRSVRLVVTETEVGIRRISYVEDPDKANNEQGYVSVFALRGDKAKARRVLEKELARAEAAMGRALEVADSLGLSSEVNAILASLRGIKNAA
jgi:hypothetical protein